MPTRAETRNGGVQAAVHDVAEHARTLVRLEAELAALEVRQKVAALGTGAVLLAAGGLQAIVEAKLTGAALTGRNGG